MASYYYKKGVILQKKSSSYAGLHPGDVSRFQGDIISVFLKVPVLMYKVVWQNSQMYLKAYLIMNQSLNVIPCASAPFKLRTSGCFSHQRRGRDSYIVGCAWQMHCSSSRCKIRAL